MRPALSTTATPTPVATAQPPQAAAAPPGGFYARHLPDYNTRARCIWSVLVALGLVALVDALWGLRVLPAAHVLPVALGVAFVALIANFPVQIPRTHYSFSGADIFVFCLLALYGVPAAVLAATADVLVGALRVSKRLSSRASTPAAAASAMLLCGFIAEGVQASLVRAGIEPGLAGMAALCLASMVYFAGTTLPLLALVAARQRKSLSLRAWLQNYGWLAGLYLASACLAGILVVAVRQYGTCVIALVALVASALLAIAHNTMRRHEAEHQAQEQRIAEAQRESVMNLQRFTAAFTSAAIGMAIVRPDGTVTQCNQALCALLGQPAEELLNQRFDALLHAGDDRLFMRRVEAMSAGDGDPFSMELRCRVGDQRSSWVSLHCSHFAEPGVTQRGLILQLHDITSRRLAEDELHHIAYHDGLTDLANRNCFNVRLGEAVERTRTDATRRFAVMFLDLDRFKVVNDSLGHQAGNQLLREIAGRLSDSVRPGDLVARLGGDEFAVLLDQISSPDAAMALANRLLQAVAAPLLLNGTELMPTASIGITFSDLGYRSAEEVLRDADLAMYASKAEGRHRVMLFDVSMHERIAEKLKLEGELRHAIGEGQLSLVFQPLYRLEPYRLTGFEVLARWIHPTRGFVGPDVFIALAEESGLIGSLTAWVIEQSVAQLAEWRAAGGSHTAELDMHVNISGRDLGSDALVDLVRQVLQRHRMPAHRLTLEITETTLMDNLEVALGTLGKLREIGCRFSIDDFGTGYSSLAYLSTLPFDSLKIDRSFVMGMDQQAQNIEIVRAVVNLGRSLGKQIIAEGIETAEQLATLKELGVDIGQGYLLSRPLHRDKVQALLATEAAPV